MRHQYQQHPLLNPTITNTLDEFVDRLNHQSPSSSSSPSILALLVGTNDGVGLARAFGTSERRPELDDDVLANVESVWATLPSGAEHHLRPLKVGTAVTTITAFYEDVVLVHAHLSPLVVTFLAAPTANVGAIRASIPELESALRNVRRVLMPIEKSPPGGGAPAAANAGSVDPSVNVAIGYAAGSHVGMGAYYPDIRR